MPHSVAVARQGQVLDFTTRRDTRYGYVGDAFARRGVAGPAQGFGCVRTGRCTVERALVRAVVLAGTGWLG
jgi:hypothetical protein